MFDSTFLRKLAESEQKNCKLQMEVQRLELLLERAKMSKSPFCHTHNINTWIPNRAEMNEVVRIVEELHSDIRRIEEVIENHLCGKKGR